MSAAIQNILVFGASSEIAQQTIRLFATDGVRFLLVGRDQAKLAIVAKDLTARGAEVLAPVCQDLSDPATLPQLVSGLKALMPRWDLVLVAHGLLGKQAQAEQDMQHAELIIRTNFTSVIMLLTPIANHLAQQGQGQLAVISSIAGDRGRVSNYVYGAAKAGLTAFLSGLRARLHQHGVSVLTILPGPTATPMVQGMQNLPLLAEPAVVGAAIHKAILARANVLYVPRIWWLIMAIIRAIPEFIYKKLKI